MSEVTSATASDVATDAWEAAYLRFETPDQEERKFVRRLMAAGAETWDREALIIDLFCGRGGGGRALRRLGFSRVLGFDLSPRLLRARGDRSDRAVADCRALPVASASADVAIVQGGLHHLPTIPEDLSAVLQEVARALRPRGLLVVVEPWSTPFLHLVHWICRIPLARGALHKLDALATMIDHERSTYEAWLGKGPLILAELNRHFECTRLRMRLGKLQYVGTLRDA
jgi:SAM-dependent methyltransferase